MTDTEDLKLRQKQFRKDTKIYSEVFSLMCQEVAELEKEKVNY